MSVSRRVAGAGPDKTGEALPGLVLGGKIAGLLESLGGQSQGGQKQHGTKPQDLNHLSMASWILASSSKSRVNCFL